MLQNDNPSIFNLTIDSATKTNLLETAKWARFLAIVGFVFLGLMVVGGIFAFTAMAGTFGSTESSFSGLLLSGFGAGMAVFYVLIAFMWFFPLLFLLRFANRMRMAVQGNDQQALSVAAQNLKVFFRYIGIITIVVLSLYALFFLIAIMGAAAFA